MLRRGDSLSVYANQAMRDAVVLSMVMRDAPGVRWHGQALIEYVMPQGRTFLRILDLNIDGEVFGEGRPCAYDNIPIKFLADMRNNSDAVIPLIRGGFDRDAAPDNKPWRRRRNEAEHLKASNVIARVLYNAK